MDEGPKTRGREGAEQGAHCDGAPEENKDAEQETRSKSEPKETRNDKPKGKLARKSRLTL